MTLRGFLFDLYHTRMHEDMYTSPYSNTGPFRTNVLQFPLGASEVKEDLRAPELLETIRPEMGPGYPTEYIG